MRSWLALAGFIVLVAALALIALSGADERPSLDGRWDLVLVETPEGTFEPEETEWIEFHDSSFTGQMRCVDFDGEFTVSAGGDFILTGWGWTGGCDPEGTGYAFANYFGHVTEIRFDPDLNMANPDGSVSFVFTRGPSAETDVFRAW